MNKKLNKHKLQITGYNEAFGLIGWLGATLEKQILYEFTIDRKKKYTIYTDGSIDLPKEDKKKSTWVINNFPIILIDLMQKGRQL